MSVSGGTRTIWTVSVKIIKHHQQHTSTDWVTGATHSFWWNAFSAHTPIVFPLRMFQHSSVIILSVWTCTATSIYNSDLDNYYPISKLESQVNKQLKVFPSIYSALSPHQSSFRPELRTISAVILVVNYIKEALHYCFHWLVKSTAFNTADHSPTTQTLRNTAM